MNLNQTRVVVENGGQCVAMTQALAGLVAEDEMIRSDPYEPSALSG